MELAGKAFLFTGQMDTDQISIDGLYYDMDA
jgi:hypothetical protein